MVYIKEFVKIMTSMEKTSKIILKISSAVIFTVYFSALLCLSLADLLFPDTNTCMFWFSEITNLGKEMISATILPVLVFELILIATGRKSREDA